MELGSGKCEKEELLGSYYGYGYLRQSDRDLLKDLWLQEDVENSAETKETSRNHIIE